MRMGAIIHRRATTATVALVLALGGCTGQLGEAPGERRNHGEVTLRDGVHQPDLDPSFVAAELLDEGDLRLRFDAAPELDIQPGDVVLGRTGRGYIVRVQEVEQPDPHTLRLRTEPATLTDAVEDLEMQFDTRAGAGGGSVETAGDDVAGRSEALTGKIKFSLSDYATLFGSGGFNVNFRDSGLDFEPDASGHLVIRGGRLEKFEMTVEGCLTARLVGEITTGRATGISVGLPVGFEVPLPTGPVTGTLSVKPSVTLSYAVRGSAHAGAEVRGCFSVSGRWDPAAERFIPDTSADLSAHAIGPHFDTTERLDVKIGFTARSTLYVYGVVGPTIANTEYMRASTVPDDGRLDWSLRSGMKASIGIDARLPGLWSARLSQGIPLFERLLDEGTLSCVSCSDGDPESGTASCLSDADCGPLERCDGDACITVAECADDSDCASDEECRYGYCEVAESCLSDADCGPLQRCDGYACITVAECAGDADCPTGEECVSGTCEPYEECLSDADCTSLQRCDGGTCVTVAECADDSDCPSGEECNSGSCEPIPECLSDADCGYLERCDGDTCVVYAECGTDSDCPSGEECNSGSCEPIPECYSDADCGSLERCDGDTCVVYAECEVDSDCPSGEECNSGSCEPDTCLSDADCDSDERCDGGTCYKWS